MKKILLLSLFLVGCQEIVYDCTNADKDKMNKLFITCISNSNVTVCTNKMKELFCTPSKVVLDNNSVVDITPTDDCTLTEKIVYRDKVVPIVRDKPTTTDGKGLSDWYK